MKNSLRYCVLLVFFALLAAAQGQLPSKPQDKSEARGQSATDQSQDATHDEASAHKPRDSLGRSTPHGTIFGFLQTAQQGKYKEAAQYLQLSKNERLTKGEELARQLHALMDDAFVGRVGAISEQPEGTIQPGVSEDHEQVGAFRINGSETQVDLVHVSDPTAGEIWLFSSQTLAEVPDLFSQLEGNKLESELPRFLATKRLFSTPLWRWIAFLLLIPVCFGLAWGLVRLFRSGRSLWMRWRRQPVVQDIHNSLAAPLKLCLTVIFHRIGIRFLGIPLLLRVYYQRFTTIILVGGGAWLAFRLVNRWGERARTRALASSEDRSGSIVLLGQRILNAVVVIAAGLAMLSILGFDMTTAVAGLGIGSIAIAFAAQKTLENLLGGVSIIGDEVIRVGETCRIEDQEGTVEDISLRSTRIRTLQRSELSVPNGKLANMNLENLSRRDKSLFRATIGFRQETSAAQLRSFLTQIRALLHADSRVSRDDLRVRFMEFAEASLDVEIHCHILTSDLSEFLAIREELLLQIMDIIAAIGIGLAVPVRTLSLTRDRDSNQQNLHQQRRAA